MSSHADSCGELDAQANVQPLDSASAVSKAVVEAAGSDEPEELGDLDLVIGSGAPQRVGRR
jgi:hypothetical protein